MSDISWSIYTLCDPREPGVVRYVGWTVNIVKRLETHIRVAQNGKDQTCCGDWKRSLLGVGVRPRLTVIETGLGNKWEEAERRWIAHYRSLVGDLLTNLAVGGGGPAGCHWKLSDETKAKIREASLRRGFSSYARLKSEECAKARRGIPLTPEHRAKLSAAQQGRVKPPEVVEKTAAFWRGRKHSDATRAKLKAIHAGLAPKHPEPIGAHRDPKTSDETKAKISASLKAYYKTDAAKSRVMSAETRAKISTALKAYRSRQKAVGTQLEIDVEGAKLSCTLEAREVQQAL